jgi:phage tail tape-measure protein
MRDGIGHGAAAVLNLESLMSRKTMVMIGMVAGSIAGGYLPTLLGADSLSMGSILGSAVGGLLGIWAALKFTGP